VCAGGRWGVTTAIENGPYPKDHAPPGAIKRKEDEMKRAMLTLTAGILLLALTATAALAATFFGTDGRDEFLGTPRADQMYAKGGDDVAQGAGGRDLIYGGYGDDRLTGDGGDDSLYDRRGSDHIYGNGGDDHIDTRDGQRDRVNCGPGRDTFTADKIDAVRNCEVPAI
jgi:Ca2+-binding RTX toxin-like protein